MINLEGFELCRECDILQNLKRLWKIMKTPVACSGLDFELWIYQTETTKLVSINNLYYSSNGEDLGVNWRILLK
jgi:hypothetical protein